MAPLTMTCWLSILKIKTTWYPLPSALSSYQQALPTQTRFAFVVQHFPTAYNTVSCTPLATIAQYIVLIHSVLCLPLLNVLCAALDVGFLASLQKTESELVYNYPLLSAPMVKCHLDQVIRNTRSAQSPAPPVFIPNATTIHHSETVCLSACHIRYLHPRH